MKPKEDAVLEFKVSFEDLLMDLKNGVKLASELDLVVCWDCPDLDSALGGLEPVYGPWGDERRIRAASYVWTDLNSTVSFQVIALRNVVAELMVELGRDRGESALETLELRDRQKIAT